MAIVGGVADKIRTGAAGIADAKVDPRFTEYAVGRNGSS